MIADMCSPTLALALELIRRPSITPDDAGCQDKLVEWLAPLGFKVERLRFGQVDNLWLRKGSEGPVLAFAGHTDVVPPGPESQWQSPPFQPEICDGLLYGRGAADMKGSLAAMVTACQNFLQQHSNHKGSIAFLITSDEEGACRDGTRRVMEQLEARQEKIDWCIVGEPSSSDSLADTIKNGRRGSLHGHLCVQGIQGHVAYPQHARNPVHQLAPALAELTACQWDKGNDFFQPTSLQVWQIAAGSSANNVIPGTCQLDFNFRFSPEVTVAQLQDRVEAILKRWQLDYQLDWQLSGLPFLTRPGPLLDAVQHSIEQVMGRPGALSTSGGTSDGRFIAPTGTEVIELGPVNRTIHQVNECVRVADLDTLSLIYQNCLTDLLA